MLYELAEKWVGTEVSRRQLTGIHQGLSVTVGLTKLLILWKNQKPKHESGRPNILLVRLYPDQTHCELTLLEAADASQAALCLHGTAVSEQDVCCLLPFWSQGLTMGSSLSSWLGIGSITLHIAILGKDQNSKSEVWGGEGNHFLTITELKNVKLS